MAVLMSIWGWVQGHGLLVLVAFNALAMALQKILLALGASLPGWLGDAVSFLGKSIDWATANLPHDPVPPAK